MHSGIKSRGFFFYFIIKGILLYLLSGYEPGFKGIFIKKKFHYIVYTYNFLIYKQSIINYKTSN